MSWGTHLRECAVVPDVAVVGEAVADEAETALLDVLLDGVEGLLLGDLHLGVGPAGDLDHHVQDAIVLVGEEGDVVEGRDDAAVLLDVHPVLCGRTLAGRNAGYGRHVGERAVGGRNGVEGKVIWGMQHCVFDQGGDGWIELICVCNDGDLQRWAETHRGCWVRQGGEWNILRTR